MKLKPIFASVVLLGLSGTAFAATTADNTTQSRLDAMQAQISQMQQIINQNGGGTQSGGGTALQSTLNTSSNWYNAISVSGLANVDAILSARSAGSNVTPGGLALGAIQPPATVFGNGNGSDLTLSNADIFVDAQVNNWTKAHIGLNYQSNDVTNAEDFEANEDQSLIINNVAGSILDEAYVTIGNFCDNPFYLRAGKQYLNFGNYDRYAAVPTFTQLLTQTNATAATVGFVDNGLYGSLFGFRGISDVGGSSNLNNFGANLGIANHNDNFGYNLGGSYLNNLVDVNYVGSTNDKLAAVGYVPLNDAGYHDKVGAVSIDGSMNAGMFDANAHWVFAVNDFSSNDLVTTSNDYATTSAARPQALVVGAGVSFDMMGHSSRFGVDYQHSWQAQNVGLYGLPQERYEATYNVGVSKNVNVGLDVFHDEDYTDQSGGSDRGTTTGLLRLGVMFA